MHFQILIVYLVYFYLFFKKKVYLVLVPKKYLNCHASVPDTCQQRNSSSVIKTHHLEESVTFLKFAIKPHYYFFNQTKPHYSYSALLSLAAFSTKQKYLLLISLSLLSPLQYRSAGKQPPGKSNFIFRFRFSKSVAVCFLIQGLFLIWGLFDLCVGFTVLEWLRRGTCVNNNR